MRNEFPPVLGGLLRFIVRTGAIAVGLWVATAVVPGITVSAVGGWATALTLFGVAVIFAIVNAVLKPVIKVLGILVYLVTFWLISFVVNALLFLLVGRLAGAVNLDFSVTGFWAAFWGAILVSLVSWAIGTVLPDPRPRRELLIHTYEVPRQP